MNALSRVIIEKFAARARAYICTYHHLDQKFEEANSAAVGCRTTTPTDTKQELLYYEIERLMKAFKGHRCALDFDRGFVNSQLREASEARRSGDDEEI